MRAIILFGAEDCHKTQYYTSWFLEHHIPYTFLDIQKDKTAALWLFSLYATHKRHFPTILIGSKRLRNPSSGLKKMATHHKYSGSSRGICRSTF